jgi:Flp pilus assembly protein TadB
MLLYFIYIMYNMDQKKRNLIVGLFSLLVVLWLVMFAVPDIFINLFDTPLGNLILFVFIILAGMHNMIMGLGLAAIFVILFRLSHHIS